MITTMKTTEKKKYRHLHIKLLFCLTVDLMSSENCRCVACLKKEKLAVEEEGDVLEKGGRGERTHKEMEETTDKEIDDETDTVVDIDGVPEVKKELTDWDHSKCHVKSYTPLGIYFSTEKKTHVPFELRFTFA